MANNREDTRLDDLPYDPLEQILLRLPPADVHRFRAVCTRWRGIIDTQHFTTSHRQRRAPKQPLFLYLRDFSLGPLGRDEHPGLVRVDLQTVDVAARHSHQVLRFADVPNPPPGPLAVEASCDGILLISYHDRLYACNPCTGHWRSLPPIHLNSYIIGFYSRDSDGGGRAYRVLYQTGDPYLDLSYRILELRAEEPHAVHDIGRPTSPERPRYNFVLLGGFPPTQRTPPTMFQGSLHWPPILPQTHKITVFDTAAQVFRWISPPALPGAHYNHRNHYMDFWFYNGAFQLLEINDRLAMAAIREEGIRVWVLKDYANQTWEPGHQIELPPAAITRDIGYDQRNHPHPHAFVVSQEGDVLLRCPYAMLHCDAVGNVLRQYRRPHHRTIATLHMFQESFVRHAFLPRRGSDGGDGEPPFFLPHGP